MRKILSFLAVAAALTVGACDRPQKDFPSQPIKLIVPFPPGGPADGFARELAQGLGTTLKQPVVVMNQGGAGGTIGVNQAAKAKPDGYTWVLASNGTTAIAPFVQKLPYEPLRDLALVSLVAKVPEVLVVAPSLPANDLESLVSYLRANPGKVSFGSSGVGSITHLAGELIKSELQVDMTHVPYKGAMPALTDLMANQVQLAVLDVTVAEPYIKAGKIKGIAILSGARVQSLPGIPSMAELGHPKINSDNWFGLAGNAKIPLEIQQRMNAATVAVLKQPSVSASYAKFSAVPAPSTPEEYRAYLLAEQAKWSAVVKTINLKQ